MLVFLILLAFLYLYLMFFFFDMINKQEVLKKTVNKTGSNVVGAAIGSLVAGPAGAIAGAGIAAACASLFEVVGDEVLSRVLSNKEKNRVTDVFELAKSEINKRIENGEIPRSDFFDNNKPTDSATELLEGTLLTSQKEYEERKNKHIAEFYANLVFHPEVSRATANTILRILSELSYRQLQIISVLGLLTVFEDNCGPLRITERPNEIRGIDRISLAVDIYNLHNKGIIHSTEIFTGIAGNVPANMNIKGLGMLMYQLCDLIAIERDEYLDAIMEYFTGENYESIVKKCYPRLRRG